ncbi:hypothetical protein POM88_032983 [Heracleum sosnowskyi]|uniref:Uncharacterized protein n=1 Tax=Heracleum sosnowskyi TaxID=360622 RepID=A0AAD8I189_9APIA|nr:hypothetical protein POM88_032983 [Heracleum sosnowskyi]
MAWRMVAQKGIGDNLIKALAATKSRQASMTATTRMTTKSASGIVRYFQESSITEDCKCLAYLSLSFMRFFHSSPELLARRGYDELNGLKAPRKIKQFEGMTLKELAKNSSESISGE